MTEIVRTLDEQGRPSFNYKTTLELLAEELMEEKCLVFLGAGASIDQQRKDLPTGRELSKIMAEKCGLEWHKYVPLSTTAFYYEFFYTRASLNRFLKKRIADPEIQPASTIKALIKIVKLLEDQQKRCIVVTTNYDQHFEEEYKSTFGRLPGVIIYNGANNPRIKGSRLHAGLDAEPEYWLPKEPLTHLYKMHGCISQPGEQNLVITEEDYINFLTNALGQDENKRLLHYVRGRIALSTILFLGYSLSDWNFRVIFKATAEGKGTTSFAVQLHRKPEDNQERARQAALIEFWGKRNIDVLNVDASQFMMDLLEHVQQLSPA